MPMKLRIVNATERSRFETTVEGEVAFAAYRLDDGVMNMYHTSVPPHLEGRGIAGELVAATVDFARKHRLKIEPACSYVAHYFAQHPELEDLRAGYRGG